MAVFIQNDQSLFRLELSFFIQHDLLLKLANQVHASWQEWDSGNHHSGPQQIVWHSTIYIRVYLVSAAMGSAILCINDSRIQNHHPTFITSYGC